MSRSNIGGKFPDELWDGLTQSTDSLNIEKNPDVDFSARFSAEIRAIEDWLWTYKDILAYIKNYGPADSILGVKADGLELEWKEITAGAGIVITNTPGVVEIESTAVTMDYSASALADLSETQPLYYNIAGPGVDKARANAAGTTWCLGLASESKAAGHAIKFRAEGALTSADWTASVGAAVLVTNSVYYLDPDTAGKLTTTAPTAVGQYVVKIGRATSTTTMDLDIRDAILL